MKELETSRISRRQFLKTGILVTTLVPDFNPADGVINAVLGPISSSGLGKALIHEHVLVDFIGADKINANRWNHHEVIKKVLPYLLEIKSRGIQSMAECTPAFIGRDPLLLQKLSRASGLNILTNTGYYGASDNKYLPQWAITESAEQLSMRWINEFENGIDGSTVKPAFIKTGVNPGILSELHQKLIRAAALAHLKTGLTICSHTGPALPAFQEIDILRANEVHPSAFVWVHANGTDDEFLRIAKSGSWISLDGIGDDNLEKNAKIIGLLKKEGMLNQVLISHDAGWFRPGEANGGEFRGFTTISDKFLPYLKRNGFEDKDIDQLMVKNPARAFQLEIRSL